MNPQIAKVYGNRVRIRVCGLCWQDDKILLVNHKSLKNSDFWGPPGGGVEFNESLTETLEREFLEETGLEIKTGEFLFGCEFIHPPLHAIELFFETRWISGKLLKGEDPELQIIEEVQFFTMDELLEMPADHLHGIFRKAVNRKEMKKLSGFYRI